MTLVRQYEVHVQFRDKWKLSKLAKVMFVSSRANRASMTVFQILTSWEVFMSHDTLPVVRMSCAPVQQCSLTHIYHQVEPIISVCGTNLRK